MPFTNSATHTKSDSCKGIDLYTQRRVRGKLRFGGDALSPCRIRMPFGSTARVLMLVRSSIQYDKYITAPPKSKEFY